MLIELRVTNFRSFRDEQIFSMVAASDKDLRESNTSTAAGFKLGVVRSAVVYGPNASGKTNLIMALGFVQLFMLTAASSPPAHGQRAIDHALLRPFVLSDRHRQSPTTFELTFVHRDVRYQYGLALDRERVCEEWLIAFPKGQSQTWFERKLRSPSALMERPATYHPSVVDAADRGPGIGDGGYTWYFGPRLMGEKKLFADITRADVPFLAAAATYGNDQLRTVYEWFTDKLAVLNPWGRPDLLGETARLAAEDPRLREQIRALVAAADFEIDDFRVRVEPITDESLLAGLPTELHHAFSALSFQRTEISMRHRAPDTADGYVDLASEDESLGTQRFFAIAGPIVRALDDGKVLAVDEIDDSLHPLLVRRLVELFHSQETNPKGAQLIMNTHDATMLDTRLFRRDQIWFTEKDGDGGSRLSPLSDYSPRKQEALSKGYLHGRYGGVPNLLDLGASLRTHEQTPAAAAMNKPRRRDAKAAE